MSEEDHESTTVTRERFKRRVRDLVWTWIGENWTTLAKVIGGAIAGGVATYLTIWVQVSSAVHAAEKALETAQRVEKKVDDLATRESVVAVNRRIDDWQFFLAQEAEKKSQSRMLPPPRRK